MGKALIDNRLSPEDIERLKELHIKVAPDAPLPDFGVERNETLVMRDSEDRSKIVGLLHMEEAIEIRSIMTDPDYKHRITALTIGFNVMEGILRTRGATCYYVTVPKAHSHAGVHSFYTSEGAQIVDAKSIRYRREL